MNDYAIIKTGGKQYAVTPGYVVKIEKLEGKPGETYEFDQVLLTSLKGKVKIGSPNVKNVIVIGEIQDHKKNEKVTAFKYHNKTRYRVRKGHRQIMTDILIKDISSSQIKIERKSSGKPLKAKTKKTIKSRK